MNLLARVRGFFGTLGPGLIAGASDDDPSGIGTYAQAGALFGYATLWTAVLTFPLSATIQYICAKVALVSGRGLAGALARRFPRAVLYPAVLALAVANTINAGVDIGAIAAALNLLIPVRAAVLVVPITLLLLALLVLGSYRVIERTFKWLTLALLAYVGSAFLARPDLQDVLRNTLVPTISLEPAFLLTMIAIFGTTISPYLFFYQAEDEIELLASRGRKSLNERREPTPAELRAARSDVTVGIAFSNIVMYFIVLAAGATLHASGQTHIGSAAEAARALEPIAGDAAELLFAAGIVGSGVLAVPVLVASASYAVAEAAGWKRGLDEKPRQAPRFYLLIAISMLAGAAIDFLGINPIDALFWTAVMNGLLTPPLLVLIMLVARDRSIMGARTNGRWTNAVGWGTAGLMGGAAVLWLVLTALG